MNAYAYDIKNHHIDSMLEQSAYNERVARLFPQPTLRERSASAVAGLRRTVAGLVDAFAGPVDLSAPVLPNLESYPYRG